MTKGSRAPPASRGKIQDKTLEQLRKLDIGKWRKPAFRGEKILTLEEALEIIAGNVDLCLEIKTAAAAPAGIELKLLFILSHYDYLERTTISSFDYRSLARVRELAPEATLGIIYGASIKEDPFAAAERLRRVVDPCAKTAGSAASFSTRPGKRDWMSMSGLSTICARWKPLRRWACKE